MTINVGAPELRELKPRILVLGVGGAGGNAINGMIEAGLQGVEFVAVNTDAQDLRVNKAKGKIQLGMNLTGGLGAGARVDVGQAAANESLNDIINLIQGANMCFITAGMGGGTGTGAAHIIAKAAKELNILTVGVVTLPFLYEGPSRMQRAHVGLEELKKHVDTMIVIPNQNLFKIANEKTTFEESFHLSNNVLQHGVQSVTDLMVRPGLINLDFADVESVMSGMGKAMMGTGQAEGEGRAKKATELALNNPLIDEYSLRGAKGLLVNITGGKDLTLFEVDEAVNAIRAEVDPQAELIIGAITDSTLEGKMRVSVVATSLDGQEAIKRPVVSMVHRIHSRNPGYSGSFTNDASLSQQTSLNNGTNYTQGATVLKLDNETTLNLAQEKEVTTEHQKTNSIFSENLDNISSENLGYMEHNQENNNEENLQHIEIEKIEKIENDIPNNEDEFTPHLFTDDGDVNPLDENLESKSEDENEELMPKSEEEEDYEIPAFLRKQKN